MSGLSLNCDEEDLAYKYLSVIQSLAVSLHKVLISSRTRFHILQQKKCAKSNKAQKRPGIIIHSVKMKIFTLHSLLLL